MLKKTLSAIALAAAALGAQAADVLKVAATAVPHAEILNFVKPQLKAQGLDLQVKEFSDYVQPNAAVEDKQLTARAVWWPCPTARSMWSPLAPTPARSRT